MQTCPLLPAPGTPVFDRITSSTLPTRPHRRATRRSGTSTARTRAQQLLLSPAGHWQQEGGARCRCDWNHARQRSRSGAVILNGCATSTNHSRRNQRLLVRQCASLHSDQTCHSINHAVRVLRRLQLARQEGLSDGCLPCSAESAAAAACSCDCSAAAVVAISAALAACSAASKIACDLTSSSLWAIFVRRLSALVD
jgi:hypothetical protein